jgi:hypothetical protein
MLKTLLLACAMIAAAAPASAETLRFTAALNGNQAPTITGSMASGTALVSVDSEARTLDVTLDVAGISRDDLWDHVIHAGVGPVHLHLYAANGDISLLVPFPYGAAYADAPNGFRLAFEDLPYAENAALVGSELSFEQFVATLGADFVYLNIHTDAFQDGEISGQLAPAS